MGIKLRHMSVTDHSPFGGPKGPQVLTKSKQWVTGREIQSGSSNEMAQIPPIIQPTRGHNCPRTQDLLSVPGTWWLHMKRKGRQQTLQESLQRGAHTELGTRSRTTTPWKNPKLIFSEISYHIHEIKLRWYKKGNFSKQKVCGKWNYKNKFKNSPISARI